MPRFPLFGTSQRGKSVHHTAQRRINLYGEMHQDADRAALVFYQRPGLELFTDGLGETAPRGMLGLKDKLYVVHRGTLYSIDNAAAITSEGTLDTASGRVDMATNGTELLIVDGTEGYIYESVADSFAKITDADFPVCSTCAYQGGFFIVPDEAQPGRFHVSSSYDGTAWDATEFATAEGFPDALVRVFVDHNEVFLFGTESTEIWSNIGALDFPYRRIDGASPEWGLAAKWSVARFNNTVAWLAQNRMGEVQVVQLQGYVPQRLSTPDLEYEINQYSDVADASALSYLAGGHPFYQLNFPTAGVSWAFDGLTGMWSQWEYATLGARHRAEFGASFQRKTFCADYEDGKIYKIDQDVLTDNGVSFAKELVSRHIFEEDYTSIGRLWLDMETGVGTASGDGSDPQVMLSVSKDGGKSFGPERWVSAGKQGEYQDRALWRRLGRAYEWTFKVRMSDPVRMPVSAAWVST